MTQTLAPNAPPRHKGGNTPSIPRRMPPEVFDTLRAITGNGPSFAYDEVRAQVRARFGTTSLRHRTQVHLLWRVAFTDVIRDQAGRDPEQITVAGTAVTVELAHIATDAHTGRITPRGMQARRALNGWLARAIASQQ